MQDTEYAEQFQADTPFSEFQEMEYAAKFLEIIDEGELDRYLGRLMHRGSLAAGQALKAPVARVLGGYLKSTINRALPGVGAAMGDYPIADSTVERKNDTSPAELLGLELEGLSGEDQEFEIARRLVRLVGAASQKAAQAAPDIDSQSVAKQALLTAGRKYAPGLLRGQTGRMTASEVPFDEVEELALAAELMEMTNDAELDRFIGNLLRKAGRAAGVFLKTPIGQQVGGWVKGAIKKGLPSVGAVTGDDFTADTNPSVGKSEEQEFETARQLVRFAGSAASKAAQMPRDASAPAAARVAVSEAARRHLPGRLHPVAAMTTTRNFDSGMEHGSNRSGRWIRNGGAIVLLDLGAAADHTHSTSMPNRRRT